MFEIMATFGVSWKVAVLIGGYVFWAASSGVGSSIWRATLFAASAGIAGFLVVMIVGLGVGYLVSKYYSQSKLSMW